MGSIMIPYIREEDTIQYTSNNNPIYALSYDHNIHKLGGRHEAHGMTMT